MNLCNNLKLIYQVASRYKLPIESIGAFCLLRLNLGKKTYFFKSAALPLNAGAAAEICRNKKDSKILYEELGYPTLKFITLTKDNWKKGSLAKKLTNLNYPLVAKPAHGTSRGKDVLCNIKDEKTLIHYLQDAFEIYPEILIEEFISHLNEYRITVFNNKVVGVVARLCSFIQGDGVHTVKELVELDNVKRIELGKTITYSPIDIDKYALLCLEEQGLTPNSIPENLQKVRMGYAANTGRGGDFYSMGTAIHPENAKKLIEVTKDICIKTVGYDILCDDILKPFSEQEWLIIEGNCSSDLTIHEIPHQGIKTPIIKQYLKHLIKKHPISYAKYVLAHLFKKSH